jgi:hypothetical protein
MMAKLTTAQRRVMDCLNAGGWLAEDEYGDYQLSDKGQVRDCTVIVLRGRGLIRFVPNDGPRGVFYARRDDG